MSANESVNKGSTAEVLSRLRERVSRLESDIQAYIAPLVSEFQFATGLTIDGVWVELIDLTTHGSLPINRVSRVKIYCCYADRVRLGAGI